jgi:transposase
VTKLMGEEKQRISEWLGRLDAEREKLSAQLYELETAERVLARFGRKAVPTGKRGRARPAATAPPVGEKRKARGNQQMRGVSLSDAILKAVQAHKEGATASEVLNYLSREFGMTVRPNHLGMALQRHRRAGRLDNRDQRWHLPPSA